MFLQARATSQGDLKMDVAGVVSSLVDLKQKGLALARQAVEAFGGEAVV